MKKVELLANGTMKACAKCKQILLLTGFCKDKAASCGFRSWCKKCNRAKGNSSLYSRRYREKHKNNPDFLKRLALQKQKQNVKRKGNIEFHERLKKRYRERKEYEENFMQKRRDIKKYKRVNLSDEYIKVLIVADASINWKLIPNSLVKLKREQLKISRFLKEVKNGS